MRKVVDVILLCGGKGTRFREITNDKIPKSLYTLNGEELIRLTVNNLDFSLVNRLIFAVDHHADSVKAWVSSQNFPCPVYFSYQTEPGVLGAVEAAMQYVECNDFIICNTDELRHGLSLEELLDTHCQTDSHATMATTYSDHLFYHRVIRSGATNVVESTELKNQEYQNKEHLVGQINIGFIVFRKNHVALFDKTHGIDWSSLINPLVDRGLLRVSLNPGVQYFNIGTRRELEQAQAYIQQPKENNPLSK